MTKDLTRTNNGHVVVDGPGPLDPDDSAALWDLEQERLANQTPLEWWAGLLDGLGRPTGVVAAFDLLSRLLGGPGHAADELAEIHELARGYPTFTRKQLLPHAKQLRQVADQLDAFHMSPLVHGLPNERPWVDAEALRQRADDYEEIARATKKDAKPWLTRATARFTRTVMRAATQKNGIGKCRAQAAVALLITVVTDERMSAAAVRMRVSRQEKKIGRVRPIKRRRRRDETPAGGNLRPQARWRDERLANEESGDDGQDSIESKARAAGLTITKRTK
jgi:hypothetical protein